VTLLVVPSLHPRNLGRQAEEGLGGAPLQSYFTKISPLSLSSSSLSLSLTNNSTAIKTMSQNLDHPKTGAACVFKDHNANIDVSFFSATAHSDDEG